VEEWNSRPRAVSNPSSTAFPPPIYEENEMTDNLVTKAKSVIYVATPNVGVETIYVPARFQGPRWEATISAEKVAKIRQRIPFQKVRIGDKGNMGQREIEDDDTSESPLPSIVYSTPADAPTSAQPNGNIISATNRLPIRSQV
jgi:hypothetical protein